MILGAHDSFVCPALDTYADRGRFSSGVWYNQGHNDENDLGQHFY